ncbi:MAG TPA: amidohydrolase [Jatrophihabitantaceae bacterium]|nr:amidohydrolase [Jatrophihabitantaceae bacterium]
MSLIELRRDLHAHPELAFAEHRTTNLIVDRLRTAGLNPTVLPGGTGAVCDIGTGGRIVGLRADIDALPIQDLKQVPYRSTVRGACHGCGHDAHTAILLGAAAELATQPLPGQIRLIFQPGEETLPGGALSVVAAGVLDGVERIFALHCDPRLETGQVGLRIGPITAACDHIEIELNGPGGHTARPHMTVDLVYALGLVITELPGLLSRRVDPRSALSLVWGAVEAGIAINAIPSSGCVRGTLRVFDRDAWDAAEPLLRELVEQIVAPTGAKAEISYVRGVPPVLNDADSVAVQRRAVLQGLGPSALAQTVQSMGGEDFAWYLEHVPGALARLGVRRPGMSAFDLHQGTFDIDEDALDVGVRYTVELARTALLAE